MAESSTPSKKPCTKHPPKRPPRHGYQAPPPPPAQPPPAQPPSVPPLYIRYLPHITDQQQDMVNKAMNRSIIVPNYLDNEFFNAERFNICMLLDNVHLLSFATLHSHFSELMIKAFYANMKYYQDTKILSSVVTGRSIQITPTDWATLIDYSEDDILYFDRYDFAGFENYQRLDFLPTVLRAGVQVPTTSKFSATLLSVPHRVLHYVITHTIIPRGGNHAVVYYSDLFIIWTILNGVKINWPNTFCRVMLISRFHDTCASPYPMLIQKMLELKNINMTGGAFFTIKDNHKFGSTQLKKVGIRKIDGAGSGSLLPLLMVQLLWLRMLLLLLRMLLLPLLLFLHQLQLIWPQL